MSTRLTKTARYLCGAGRAAILAGLPVASLAAPTVALASWGEEITGAAATESGGKAGDTISADTLNDRITSITSWLLGIAVAIFILKVVLTGVDRILMGNEADAPNHAPDSPLVNIPVVGAYPTPDRSGKGYTWKKIFINFFMQIAICVGAWVIVNFIVGLIGGALDSFDKSA